MPSSKKLLRRFGLILNIIQDYSPAGWNGEDKIVHKFIENSLKEIEEQAKNLDYKEFEYLYKTIKFYVKKNDFRPSPESHPLFGYLLKNFIETLETQYTVRNRLD